MDCLEKRYCEKCHKKMRTLKDRDFAKRKFCLKCHKENDRIWQYKEFIKEFKKIYLIFFYLKKICYIIIYKKNGCN